MWQMDPKNLTLNYNLGKLPEMLQLPYETDFLQNHLKPREPRKSYNNKIIIIKRIPYSQHINFIISEAFQVKTLAGLAASYALSSYWIIWIAMYWSITFSAQCETFVFMSLFLGIGYHTESGAK